MNSPLRQRSVHLVKRGTLLDRLRRAGFAPAAQPPFTPAFGANASQARPLPSCFALLPRRSHPTLMNTYKNAKHMLCIRSASSVTERVGFEPTRRFPDDRISSAARYDHFDISPGCRLKSRLFMINPSNCGFGCYSNTDLSALQSLPQMIISQPAHPPHSRLLCLLLQSEPLRPRYPLEPSRYRSVPDPASG